MATKRIQIDLQDKSLERLERIKQISEATSYAEVIKNALRLYEYFIDLDESGSKVCISSDKGITPISIF